MSKSISVSEAISLTEERFKKINPIGISYAAEQGYVIQILKNNPFIMKVAQECPESLQQAMTNIAGIGLSLNPAKKQAYLITRNVKVAQNKWQTRIFLEPSYMGLCDVVTSSGMIDWIQCDVCYENDDFKYSGPGEKPLHVYDPRKQDQRGKMELFYSVAKTSKGDYLTEIMPICEIYSIRDRSEAWKNKIKKAAEGKEISGGPWETDFIQMAKKTVVRRQYKMLPKSKEMDAAALAVHLSNENEGFEEILTSPEIRDFTADQKHYFDGLISNNDALEMFVFSQTIDESVFTNLYHSFEKGKKGKYQAIVDSLTKKGRDICDECISLVVEADGDDIEIQNITQGMSPSCIDYIIRMSK